MLFQVVLSIFSSPRLNAFWNVIIIQVTEENVATWISGSTVNWRNKCFTSIMWRTDLTSPQQDFKLMSLIIFEWEISQKYLNQRWKWFAV